MIHRQWTGLGVWIASYELSVMIRGEGTITSILSKALNDWMMHGMDGLVDSLLRNEGFENVDGEIDDVSLPEKPEIWSVCGVIGRRNQMLKFQYDMLLVVSFLEVAAIFAGKYSVRGVSYLSPDDPDCGYLSVSSGGDDGYGTEMGFAYAYVSMEGLPTAEEILPPVEICCLSVLPRDAFAWNLDALTEQPYGGRKEEETFESYSPSSRLSEI